MSAHSPTDRPVAVVEWNSGGHHETYLAVFVTALRKAGRSVAVLCREPERLRMELGEGNDVGKEVHIEPINGAEWLSERRRWPFGVAFMAYAAGLTAGLKRAERALGAGEAEIYFACLYEHQTRMIDAVLRRLGRRTWSGLYMQAHCYHRPERRAPGVKTGWPITRLWRRQGLRGLLMLDEGIASRVEADIGRPVRVMPDFALATRNGQEPLAEDIRRWARGRALIGLLGHLLPSKGVGTAASAALLPEATELGFLFAGEVHWKMFDGEEAMLLRRLRDGERGNVWLREGRVPDEAAYNALVCACDVLCAAYRDFPHSSNTLAKAALFEKPVVVSDGHLMARRVRDYRLGEVVPQDDPQAILTALLGITRNPTAWRSRMRPRWAEYRNAHSVARLGGVVAEFFGAPRDGAQG
jgi:glycosyltransferase involved in cell wall biosynthesis